MKKNDFSIYKGSLKDRAFKSENSLGRRRARDEDSVYFGVINPYVLDIIKIIQSKSYRELDDKTQVFPEYLVANSNIRNRARHTQDVVCVAMMIAEILGLNTFLVEAMAYGHDIGHGPYGHAGERFIKEFYNENFTHNVMSVVVAQHIERKGKGLNLTYESLEGIRYHSRGAGEMYLSDDVSEEANLVMFADKIAYTFADLSDAIRLDFFKGVPLPNFIGCFGKNQREMVANTTFSLIKESSEEGKVSFTKSELAEKFKQLREWMYENVYFELDKRTERKKVFRELEEIYSFILKKFNGKLDPFLVINRMTDSEASSLYKSIVEGTIQKNNYGFLETVNNFIDKKINILDSDLDKKDFSRKNL